MSEQKIERKRIDRKQVDPRDTFDWTTPNLDVTAHPTDPYIQPKTTSDASRLAQALGLVQSGVESYTKYKDTKNKYDYKEGVLDQAQHKEIPLTGSSAAYIRGWEEANGETIAQEFERQASDLFNQYKDKDPIEFEKAYQDLSNDFLNSRLTTKSELKGFISRASQTESKVKLAYTEYQQQAQQDLKYEKINSIFDTDIRNEITDLLGIKDLDTFYNDPEAYLKYYSNKDVFQNATVKDFREYLSDAFKKYESLGLNKKEISTLYYNNIKAIADLYDMPELLEYAFKKDANGIAVNDNPDIKMDLEKTLTSIRSSQATKLAQINKTLNANNKQYVETKQNELTFKIALLQPGQQKEAKALLKEILDDPILMADSSTKELAKPLEDIIEGNGHPDESDSAVYDHLQHLLGVESLTEKEIIKNKNQLCWSDYKSVWNDLQTQKEQAKNRNKTLGSTGSKAYKEYKKAIISSVISEARAVDTFVMGAYRGAGITPSITNELYVKIKHLESKNEGYIPPEVMEKEIITYFNNKVAIFKNTGDTSQKPKESSKEPPTPSKNKNKNPKQQRSNRNNDNNKKQIIKRGIDKKTGEKIIKYSDGTVTYADK